MPEQTQRMQWPYPTNEEDPWFDSYEQQMAAQDASAYAAREDRHAILAEGGTVTWNSGTGALSWGGTISITSPITGFRWQITPRTVTLADGETVHAVLTRGPGSSVNVAVASASTVPSTDEAFALVTRIGTRVYWRNGLKLENGDSISNLGSGQGSGGSSDLRTSPIIVGNAASGDTISDADYLDTGNGAQLFAALAAATSDTEIFLRPGVYDLGAVGSPASPLSILSGVKVRGAGKSSVTIRTRASGDMGALALAADAEVSDVGVEVSLPTGAGSGSLSVVAMNGNRSAARRVRVTYLGVYGAPQASNLFLRRSFGVANALDDVIIVDPEVVSAPSLRANGVGDDLLGITVVGGTVDLDHACMVVRPVLDGADWGISVLNRSIVVDPIMIAPYMGGITVDAQGSGSEIRGGSVRNAAPAGTWIGVRILNAVDRVAISGTQVLSSGAPVGSIGVLVDGTATMCRVWGTSCNGLETGVSLTGSTTKNAVMLNALAGNTSSVSDLGSLNDVAHNLV